MVICLAVENSNSTTYYELNVDIISLSIYYKYNIDMIMYRNIRDVCT